MRDRAALDSRGRSKKRFGPQRSDLLDKHAARGRQHFNLWYHYSARLKRDLIFSSDAEFEHFCWLEGDPKVLTYELQPAPLIVAVGSDVHRTQFDARVERRGARPEFREVKETDVEPSIREQHQTEAQLIAANRAGFDYRRITRADLDEHRQLIQNWRRALAFLAACRDLVITPFRDELMSRFRDRPHTTLGELLLGTDPALHPVYLSASFSALQNNLLTSDLSSTPLCANTKLVLRDDSHE